MYKFLTKNGQSISFIVGALLVVAFYAFIVMSGDYETFTAMDADGIKDKARYDFDLFDFGIGITAFLIAIGAILMIGFGLFQAATNIKGSLGAVAGLALIGIIFAIGYSTTDLETTGSVYDAAMKFELGDGTRKFVGGSITTGVALIAIASLGIVVSEIRNFFK